MDQTKSQVVVNEENPALKSKEENINFPVTPTILLNLTGIWWEGNNSTKIVRISQSPNSIGFTITPHPNFTWVGGCGSINTHKMCLFSTDGLPVPFTFTLSNQNTFITLSNSVTWTKQIAAPSTHVAYSNVLDALRTIGLLFPSDAADLQTHQTELVNAIMSNVDPPAESAIWKVSLFKEADNKNIADDDLKLGDDASSACRDAIISCVVDVVLLLGSAVGVRAGVTKAVLNDAFKAKSLSIPMNKFWAACGSITMASSEVDEAEAVGRIFQVITTTKWFFQTFYALVKLQVSHWWQWVRIVVVFVSHVAAWIATDMLALAAQVILMVDDLATVVQDIISIISNCGPSSKNKNI